MKTAKTLATGQDEAFDASIDPQAFSVLRRNERLVLDQLVRAGKPMKAYEILELLNDEGIRAPMTVYRALDNLTRTRLVKKISCLNAYHYVGVTSPSVCTAFLICRHCQKTFIVEVDGDRLRALFEGRHITEEDAMIELMTECQGGCERRSVNARRKE